VSTQLALRLPTRRSKSRTGSWARCKYYQPHRGNAFSDRSGPSPPSVASRSTSSTPRPTPACRRPRRKLAHIDQPVVRWPRRRGLDGVAVIEQGDIWLGALSRREARPYLVVTHGNEAIDGLEAVVAAPVTSTRRGLPSELDLGPAEGLRRDCVANFDNLGTVRKAYLTHQLGMSRTVGGTRSAPLSAPPSTVDARWQSALCGVDPHRPASRSDQPSRRSRTRPELGRSSPGTRKIPAQMTDPRIGYTSLREITLRHSVSSAPSKMESTRASTNRRLTANSSRSPCHHGSAWPRE